MNAPQTASADHQLRYAALFSPYRLGNLDLKNRMVMAPMTRTRAGVDGVPSPLAPAYYAQRAGAGLIITEATHATPDGGQYRTPGLVSPAQVAAWTNVVDAVHRAGGKIFVQLWHTGRTSHPDLRGGKQPVAPSPIPADGETRVSEQDRKPRVVPRALEISEIAEIVADFRRGAENAKAAGFDGVELHGANGYLIDQFTRDGANHRTDAYGGTIEKRARFGLEVADAVIGVLGAGRVGYRISPRNPLHSNFDSDPVAAFSHLTTELSRRRIGYLHVVDPIADGAARTTPILRPKFDGTYIVNGGYDPASANAAIQNGEADLVAFGAPFLANPDLPHRYETAAALNEVDRTTLYSTGAKGYTDYPALT